MYCDVCNKYRKFKKILKYRIFLRKQHLVFLLLTVSVVMNMKKYLKYLNIKNYL